MILKREWKLDWQKITIGLDLEVWLDTKILPIEPGLMTVTFIVDILRNDMLWFFGINPTSMKARVTFVNPIYISPFFSRTISAILLWNICLGTIIVTACKSCYSVEEVKPSTSTYKCVVQWFSTFWDSRTTW